MTIYDRFGNRIAADTWVVWANHKGSSSAEMNVGRVIDVVPAKARWSDEDTAKLRVAAVYQDWDTKERRVKVVTLTAVERVLAYSEGMLRQGDYLLVAQFLGEAPKL